MCVLYISFMFKILNIWIKLYNKSIKIVDRQMLNYVGHVVWSRKGCDKTSIGKKKLKNV